MEDASKAKNEADCADHQEDHISFVTKDEELQEHHNQSNKEDPRKDTRNAVENATSFRDWSLFRDSDQLDQFCFDKLDRKPKVYSHDVRHQKQQPGCKDDSSVISDQNKGERHHEVECCPKEHEPEKDDNLHKQKEGDSAHEQVDETSVLECVLCKAAA